jgi:hypothetical protein
MKRRRKKNTKIYRIFNYSLQFADEKIARDPDFDGPLGNWGDLA